MCAAYSNADFPFGSARFANPKEIARAGLYDYDPDAVFIGFDEDRPLFYGGMGGVLICAGARSGKLKDVLSYNLCTGVCRSTCLILDPKGELAAISQDQTADHKFRITWNPHLKHGLPGNKSIRWTSYREVPLPSYPIPNPISAMPCRLRAAVAASISKAAPRKWSRACV